MQIIIIFLLAIGCLEAAPMIGGYYDKSAALRSPNHGRAPFALEKLPKELLTDLYYAFASFENGRLVATDPDKKAFTAMQELKKNSKNLNLFLSIGGWGFNDPIEGSSTYKLFSQALATESARREFINQLITFSQEYGFDGIDIDWEYPGDLTRGGSEQDLDNFLLFLKELKGKRILSAAFPAAVPQGLPKKFKDDPNLFFQWIKACSEFLDQVHVMTYDYHTPFDDPKITGVNAPLERETSPNSYLYIAKSLQNYLDNGVPKEKIVLGIPLFGHGYLGVSSLTEENYFPGKPFRSGTPPSFSTRTPGMLAYYEIADLIASNALQFSPEPLTNTAIAFSVPNQEWISFDTPETIQQKAAYAAKNGLKGIFFWSIDMDEYQWAPQFPGVEAGKSAF